MAMLSRAGGWLAAALRTLRKSDVGVTAVEYGVMFAIFGTGMLAGVTFLVSAATSNYEAAETDIGAAPIVCETDEFYDGTTGVCVPKVQCAAGEWANPATNVCEEAVTCGVGFSVDQGTNTCLVNGTPGAPTNLSATLEAGPKANLSWTAPQATGGGATTYLVQQATVATGPWTTIATQAATSFITNTLSTSTAQYFYQVIAQSGAGVNSLPSAAVVVSFQKPSAPTITGITASIVSSNQQLSIAFTPPVFTSGLTSYQYSLTGAGGPFLDLPSVDATSPIVVASGLAANTEYLVSIRAIRVISPGNVVLGDASAPFRVRTVGPAGPPRILAVEPGDARLTVSFCAPQFDGSVNQTSCTTPASITNYKYSLNGGAWISAATTTSPFAITTGVTNGTLYSVRILAVNAQGDGTPSAAVSATPGVVPAAPSITSVTGGARQLTVNFTVPTAMVPPITSYQYSTDDGVTWASRTTGTTATPLVITTTSAGGQVPLDNGTNYKVKLRAINAIGNGAPSTYSCTSPSDRCKTSNGVPNAPVITAVAFTSPSGTETLTATFTAPSNGGSNITKYQYTTDNGATWKDRSTGTSGSSLTMAITTTSPTPGANLTEGTTYTIQIRAVNAVGDGTPSNAFTATAGVKASAPTGLVITPGNQQLSVAFTAPSGILPAITSYQYSTDNGQTWRTRETGTTASPLVITRTSGTFARLTNGTTYQVKIRAINAAGVGTQSSAVAGTPCGPPGKPTAVAGALRTGPVGIRVTWTAPTYTGGCAVSGYKVQWSSNGGSTWSAAKDDAGSPADITKGSPDNLTAGTTYVFRVAAENSGGVGAYSNISAAVVTPPVPNTPAPPTAALTASPAGIRVTYSAPGGSTVTNYVIERSADGGAYGNPLDDTVSPLDIAAASLAPSTDFTFRVSAENDWGSSAFSSASNIVPTPSGPATPAAPGVSFSATVSDVTVTYPSGTTEIQQSVNGGAFGASIPVSGTTRTFTGMNAATTYAYRIVASNGWGTATGPSASVLTPSAPSAPVIGSTSDTGTRRITVSWTASPNATTYTVNRTNPSSSNTCAAWSGTNQSPTASPNEWTGLTNNRYYCFRVRATNGWGTSGWSGTAGPERAD